MNTEAHLRQMIGDMVFRIAMLSAEIDALRAHAQLVAVAPPDAPKVDPA